MLRWSVPNSFSQLSRIFSNTGADVRDRVADHAAAPRPRRVCCSSASCVSLNRRTFSIAITAWSEKVWTKAISAGVNGRTWLRSRAIAPIDSPFENHWHRQHGAKAVLRLQLAHVGKLGFDERDDVVEVQGSALEERPADDRGRPQDQLCAERIAPIGGAIALHRVGVKLAAGLQPDAAAFGPAQQAGALGDDVEHRLHVRGRAAHHVEHLGGRRLPLERLLGLVEQAHVLDRDHRLVGEGLEDRFMARRYRPGVAESHIDRTDGLPVAQHRCGEETSPAARMRGHARRKRDPRSTSSTLQTARCQDDPSRHELRRGPDRIPAPQDLARCRGRAVAGNPVHELAIEPEHLRRQAFAERPRVAGDGLEDRLHVVWRFADDAQNLGRRGLLLQRFLRFVEQPRVLDRDHGLVGEGLREGDLLVVEVAGGLAQDRQRAERLAVLQQRNEEAGAVAERDREVGHPRELLGPLDRVGDGDDSPLEDARSGAAAAVERPRLEEADALRGRPSAAKATSSIMSPRGIARCTALPPNRRRQLCTIASNTGCVSVIEPLMTRRISAVAVCCSSASLVSLNRRTFSIAITAWSAKVCSQRRLPSR